MQKKENLKFKEESDEFRKIIEAKKQDEEEIDLTKYQQQENKDYNAIPQSKLMQARVSSQAKQRPATTGVFSSLGGNLPQQEGEGLLYQPMKLQENEEDKILRYERVIDQLKKMVDNVKK